jgi:hypothetical protein
MLHEIKIDLEIISGPLKGEKYVLQDVFKEEDVPAVGDVFEDMGKKIRIVKMTPISYKRE